MFNMETRIKIFETNKQDGVLCRNKKFYDSDLSEENIKLSPLPGIFLQLVLGHISLWLLNFNLQATNVLVL